MTLSYNNSVLAQTISVSGTQDTTITGTLIVTSGVTIGTNSLTTTNTLDIINSSNLYLWSNFR
jgi:hypothetical protein